MDQSTQALALVIAAIVGIVAVLLILRQGRKAIDAKASESRFATSTEGMKRCPNCGAGNLVTDANCSNCGKRLPG